MNGLLSLNNRMFAMARGGRRLTNPIVAIVIVLLAPFVLQIVGVLPLILLGVPLFGAPSDGSALDGAVTLILLLVFGFGPIFLFLWAWVALFEKRSFWTLGVRRSGALRWYLIGFLLGLLMFGATVGAAAFLGYAAWDRSTDPALRGASALGAVLLTYVGWTVQGPAEEILTRGWLLQVVGVRWGSWAGIIVSSAVFTVLHSLNPNLSPISVLNLFLVGIFLALWVLYEGALWGVFAWHAVWNWAQGNLFGYEVSGTNPQGGALFDMRETGPDVVTGGPFGPEGGLAVTAVLLVGIAAVFVLASRRGAMSPGAPVSGNEREPA